MVRKHSIQFIGFAACLVGTTAIATAAEPTIVFEKQPAALPGNPPPAGSVEYKLKWSDCTNAQKLEITIYEVLPGDPVPPPNQIGGFAIDPIPGGANGNSTFTSALTSGKKVFFKAKVINNATPPVVIAEETSVTVTVP